MTAMARDAYTAAGSVMRTIQSVDDGLRVLRDTTNATATGVLQRTIIDKLLALPKATHDAASQRRVVKGEHGELSRSPTRYTTVSHHSSESLSPSV